MTPDDTTNDATDNSDITHADIFDGRTLSDLFVNAVPIAIIAVFVLGFSVFSPFGRGGGEPLLLFHLALVGGVVLVSYVGARAIAGDEAREERAVPKERRADDGER